MSRSTFDGIKSSKKILKMTGNWPEASTVWSRLRGHISLLIATIFVITLAMEVVRHLNDYQVLTDHLAITITPTSFLFKLIIFKYEYGPFLILLQRMDLDVFNNYPKHLEEIMRKSNRMSVVIGIIYRGTCYTVVFLYCTMPLVTKADLPIRFSYDFQYSRILIYIIQILGLANAVLVDASLDLLAVGLMVMAAVQLDILNKKIIEFKSRSRKGKKDTENYISYLKDCVDHHNEIIRYIENVENAFSMMFLVQYLTSVAVICNIGFQIVHVRPASIQFVKMVFYFFAMMGQLGMYCWYGNEVIEKSAATKEACYECDWIDCDIKIRKLLITIIERTKRPLFLTAGKFSILSIASFANVIRTSYSYFTLMERLYGNTQH